MFKQKGKWNAEEIYEFGDMVHWSMKPLVWCQLSPGNKDPDDDFSCGWQQFKAEHLAKPPALPARITHPIDIQMDGDMWCAKIGENLQVGTAGFGVDPEAALCELVLLVSQFKLGNFRLAVINTDSGERLALVGEI